MKHYAVATVAFAGPAMAALADLKSFGISAERGFLPEPDPACELPSSLAPWQEVAQELPHLIPGGRLRQVLHALPPLDPSCLESDGQLRRAMQVLSYLGHAFVWGEDPPARVLPACLAKPWADVAERLGRPPVLSYASYALDNWRRFDPKGPIEIGNFALVQNFLGGVDEDWFIAIHIEIEYRAAPIPPQAETLRLAVESEDAPAAARALETVAITLERAVGVLRRMPEFCDPYIYFHRVRPYIHGWWKHPALPDGLIYEGVERFGGRPQSFRGETGAQSGIVPLLDALLGIEHADDPLRTYLMEMRSYMPPGHRAFVETVEANLDLRPFVAARADSDEERELVQTYDECVSWLEAFRGIHQDFAARYIHRQSQQGDANPTAVGTGGTPFMPYLKKHRDETADHRLRR